MFRCVGDRQNHNQTDCQSLKYNTYGNPSGQTPDGTEIQDNKNMI